MNWRDGESNPKFSAAFRCFDFQRFNYDAALKIERKMSHLNMAFDRYASIGTVMYYILVISFRYLDTCPIKWRNLFFSKRFLCFRVRARLRVRVGL